MVSEEAKILVKELLTMDPDNRHTADKTLRSRCAPAWSLALHLYGSGSMVGSWSWHGLCLCMRCTCKGSHQPVLKRG